VVKEGSWQCRRWMWLIRAGLSEKSRGCASGHQCGPMKWDESTRRMNIFEQEKWRCMWQCRLNVANQYRAAELWPNETGWTIYGLSS
jgi:hypothetical protein